MGTMICYRRVSTKKQCDSGLGLLAQLSVCNEFARQNGHLIIATYTDVASSSCKINERPELIKAVEHATRNDCAIVTAKLDRLGRMVGDVCWILDRVRVVCCDNPNADRAVLLITAVMAESEHERRNDYTKLALAALKDTGKTLGASNPNSRNLTHADCVAGARAAGSAVKKKADDAYLDIKPLMFHLRNDGATYSAIAAHLNSAGHVTRYKYPWTEVAVRRAFKRFQKHESPKSIT